MHEASNGRARSDRADRGQPALRQLRQYDAGRELLQRQPMPTEGRALYLGYTARELVRSAKACSEDKHLFGGLSGLQPASSAVNPGTAGDRSSDDRQHRETLARLFIHRLVRVDCLIQLGASRV